jgi:hypothetical protein
MASSIAHPAHGKQFGISSKESGKRLLARLSRLRDSNRPLELIKGRKKRRQLVMVQGTVREKASRRKLHASPETDSTHFGRSEIAVSRKTDSPNQAAEERTR